MVKVHAMYLPGRRRGNPVAGDHQLDSETDRSGPTIPNKDGPLELDGVLCYHRTSRHSA